MQIVVLYLEVIVCVLQFEYLGDFGDVDVVFVELCCLVQVVDVVVVVLVCVFVVVCRCEEFFVFEEMQCGFGEVDQLGGYCDVVQWCVGVLMWYLNVFCYEIFFWGCKFSMSCCIINLQ